MDKKWSTEQESFWSGQFGTEYIERNSSFEVSNNIGFFAKIFQNKKPPNSILELGPNVGLNLRALRVLFPKAQIDAVEINQDSARILRESKIADRVFHTSILEFEPTQKYDLIFTKGVLIHINPEALPKIYKLMHSYSSRYLLTAEYYSPKPEEIEYRGNKNVMFRRDFAGDILESYNDVTLVDYGFSYRRDPNFAQGDITWFLMEKR